MENEVQVEDQAEVQGNVTAEAEGPEPKHFTIEVEREDLTTEYEKIGSFKISGNLLIMGNAKSTVVVPINDSVEAMTITPVFLEEV